MSEAPKSSLYDAYETDKAAEENGQWVDMKGGVRVKVRAEDSTIVRKWIQKQAKKRRNLMMANGGSLPPELADKSDVECCADVLVVDWSGVTDRMGKVLECTRANVIQVMSDLPGLRRDVIFASRVDETFKPDTAEIEGNSSAS